MISVYKSTRHDLEVVHGIVEAGWAQVTRPGAGEISRLQQP